MIGMLVLLSAATMTPATAVRINKIQSMPSTTMEIYHPQSIAAGYVYNPGLGYLTDSDFQYGFVAEAEAAQENYPHTTAYSNEKTDGNQLSNGFRIHQKEIQFIMQEPMNDSTQAAGNAQNDIHFRIQSGQPTVELRVTLDYYCNLFAYSNCVSEGKITLRYYDQNYNIQERNFDFSGNSTQQNTIKFNMTVPRTFNGFFELRTSGSVETGNILVLSYAGSWVESTLTVTVA